MTAEHRITVNSAVRLLLLIVFVSLSWYFHDPLYVLIFLGTMIIETFRHVMFLTLTIAELLHNISTVGEKHGR